MLKTGLILAVAAVFGWRPRVVQGGRQPPVHDAPSPPVLALPPPVDMMDRDAAARAFFLIMREEIAGGWVRLRHVRTSYNQLAPSHGWPPLTDNALSRSLVALGCTRSKIDCRASHGGRPTVIHFPKFSTCKDREATSQAA